MNSTTAGYIIENAAIIVQHVSSASAESISKINLSFEKAQNPIFLSFINELTGTHEDKMFVDAMEQMFN